MKAFATVSKVEISVAAAEHLEGGTRIAAPTTTFTLEEENRIIQLLNWHIMPLIFLLFSLNVLGRSNLGNARIVGMERISVSAASSIIGLRPSFISREQLLCAICWRGQFEPRAYWWPRSLHVKSMISNQTSFLSGPNLAGKLSNPAAG